MAMIARVSRRSVIGCRRATASRVSATRSNSALTSGLILSAHSIWLSVPTHGVAVGRGRRLDDGQIVSLDVKTGDRVLFGKFTGSETKVDGTEYTIMREDDVLAILG